MSDFLKREGYELVEAEDGQQALDLFFSEKGIGLVILDVMMPRLDGWVVCREIRKASNVPVIMLTARGEESDELFGLDIEPTSKSPSHSAHDTGGGSKPFLGEPAATPTAPGGLGDSKSMAPGIWRA